MEGNQSSDDGFRKFPDDPLARIKSIASRMNDWNEFPILLNCIELDDPYIILQDFFEYLSIHEWKAELNIWLQAGLSKQTICFISKPERLLPVCFHLQKLVEAASLINIMELEGGKEMQVEESSNDNIAEEEPVRFQKPERLIDKVNRNPQNGISEIFMVLPLDDICDAIYDC